MSSTTAGQTAAYPAGLSLALDHEANASSPAAATSSDPPMIPLQVKLHNMSAKAPTRGSKYAAGYDIYVCEDCVVPARGKAMIGTGISIAIPPGTYARIAPRSGLAAKHSLATGAGVIDYDYRGEVKLIIFNHSDTDFKVTSGDRMAQMILERIVTPEVVVVEELEGTERGTGGFGSTGGFMSGGEALVVEPLAPQGEKIGVEALGADMTASELTAATMGGI